MFVRVIDVIGRVRIAFAVTAVAAMLQALYHPSKATIYGPMGIELTTFLLFGLIKVLGFLTLSLLCARVLCMPDAVGGNVRKADTYLLALLSGTLSLAVCVFLGMRAIQADAFVDRWGTGLPQAVAGAIMVALFFLVTAPLSKRQYYDMAVIANLGGAELIKIRDKPVYNSQFVRALAKYVALYFLPLFGVYVLIAKISSGKSIPVVASLANAAITCALAVASGYAIAAALRAMSVHRINVES